jgi:hypothetical protein
MKPEDVVEGSVVLVDGKRTRVIRRASLAVRDLFLVERNGLKYMHKAGDFSPLPIETPVE